jgi:predicted TIM-barrel fold metal-dependent hydrolase
LCSSTGDRIDNIAAVTGLPRTINEYFRRNVHITPGGVFSQRYFRPTLEVMGAERIMFACDYPFVSAPPEGCDGFLAAADIAEADRDRIAAGN